MRATKLVLAILALLLVGGAVQADPMFFLVSEHTMASDIGKYSEPIGRTSTFSTDDDQAVSWLLVWRDLRSTMLSGDGIIQREESIQGPLE